MLGNVLGNVQNRRNNQPAANFGIPVTANSSGSALYDILFGVVLVACTFLVFIFVELIYKYIHRMSMNRTDLLPYTYAMDSQSKSIVQNPNSRGAKTVNLSDNERSGIEFSYSFYLYADPSAFRQELGLLHIFHKGYSSQFPLLAPGVYMRSDTNTLRVYMNTFKTWNNYVEVENIPISKWVHVVVICTQDCLEVYINGNLSKKLSFDGYTPYQNYEDICCFSQRRITMKHSMVPSVDEAGFEVFGAMKGMLSRLTYFSYALGYSEIQALLSEGPSTKMDSSNVSLSAGYLSDQWWTQGH
jgi:hypothetical protein